MLNEERNSPEGRKRAKLYERYLLINRKKVKKTTFRFLLLVAALFAVWWPTIKRQIPEKQPLAKKVNIEDMEAVKRIVDSIMEAHTVVTRERADSVTFDTTGKQ